LANFFGLMTRMPVNDQENRSVRVYKQALQELQEHCGRHSALGDHETQLALGTYGRNHVGPKAGSGTRYYRGLSAFSPGGTTMKIRPHSGFIPKINLCTQLSSATTNRRVFYFSPSPYCLRILLVGPPQRPLRTQSHLPEESTHRTTTQAHTKALSNQLSDHIGSPQGKGKLQLQRILQRHRIVDPLQSLTVELGRSATPFICTKVLFSSGAIQRQPTKHRAYTNSQHIGNNSGAFPGLHTPHSTLSQFRQRLVIQCSAICFHTKRLSYNTTTCQLFCDG